MLNRVPNTMDKREGSIIYDAIAPCAVEMQLMYIELENTIKESFGDTATRPFLIKRALERGITPSLATYAVLKGEFTPTNINLLIGSRFNCNEFNYEVIEKITDSEIDGQYQLRCESIGRIGNTTFGDLIPINNIKGLESAKLTELLIPAEDEEETEHFRKRYLDSFNPLAYGGNIADYKQKTHTIEGVGGVKVTPIWNGGGTVKLTIIDSEYNCPTEELIDNTQTIMDPEQNQGEGIGLAPVGHIVAVESVGEIVINIESEFVFKDGYDIETVAPLLKQKLEEYFLSLRRKWEDNESLVVRISQIEYNFLDCVELIDVANTKINGESANLILLMNQIPKVGLINGQ